MIVAPPVDRTPIRGAMSGSAELYSAEGVADRMVLRCAVAGDRPVALEVGFGWGHFLVDLARTEPQLQVVGLEVDFTFVRRARRRAQERGVEVVAIKGDARVLLTLDVPASSLSHLFVMFPDPWWKPRHRRRRRLLSPEFLDVVARALRPGGTLLLRSDVPGYLEVSAAFVDCHPAFRRTPVSSVPGHACATRRQTRCDAAGTPWADLAWARSGMGTSSTR